MYVFSKNEQIWGRVGKLKDIKRWTNACRFFIFRRIYLQSENAEPHQSYPLRLKQSLTLREAAFCPQMGGERINGPAFVFKKNPKHFGFDLIQHFVDLADNMS